MTQTSTDALTAWQLHTSYADQYGNAAEEGCSCDDTADCDCLGSSQLIALATVQAQLAAAAAAVAVALLAAGR